MAEAADQTRGIEHVRAQINGYPRDLLKRFKSSNHLHNNINKGNSRSSGFESEEEMELNLGLSLGGCFGVDPREGKNSRGLVRSSSIAGVSTLRRCDVDDDYDNPNGACPPVACPSLTRTSSLPMESEEEWRKRKELQSLRRMEAKRKRFEKQKQFRAGRDSNRASLERPNCESDCHKRCEEDQAVAATVAPQAFGPSSWAAAAAASAVPLVRGMEGAGINGNVNANVLAAAAAALRVGAAAPAPLSQGSIGSQRSSSSGASEFESIPAQGVSNCTEARSPSSVQSLSEQQLINQRSNVVSAGPITDQKCGTPTAARADVENQSKKPKVIENGVREMGMRVMEDMPCVSTKGDGPNGKRIEGFLYRYRKGEEVRIVCVCHGKFLSPAEFVKHAGGGDVLHPLRHIVVNPSPSFLS
ncbi:hypothetical protein Scep_016434 [Stephania cephalantha]|uniref:Ninja-family protein n=1 Tax=Stephania cephalantha TaxID=152367 RepID=A0AAP0IMP0_9MAGN